MSPHHFEDTFTVSAHPNPPILMDFDADTNPDALEQLCKLKYAATGAPDLARKAAKMLCDSGLSCNVDEKRGLVSYRIELD